MVWRHLRLPLLAGEKQGGHNHNQKNARLSLPSPHTKKSPAPSSSLLSLARRWSTRPPPSSSPASCSRPPCSGWMTPSATASRSTPRAASPISATNGTCATRTCPLTPPPPPPARPPTGRAPTSSGRAWRPVSSGRWTRGCPSTWPRTWMTASAWVAGATAWSSTRSPGTARSRMPSSCCTRSRTP